MRAGSESVSEPKGSPSKGRSLLRTEEHDYESDKINKPRSPAAEERFVSRELSWLCAWTRGRGSPGPEFLSRVGGAGGFGPELGVQDSPFNRLFLEKAALLKEKSPQSMGDPSWPYRLAVRIAEHPELLRPSRGGTGPSGQAKAGGEVGVLMAELCVKTIRRRLSAVDSKEKLEDWIVGDKVVKAPRVQALLEADAATPELRPTLAVWVRKMLQSRGYNSDEDRLWVQAFLSAEKLQAPVAALVGLSVFDFQFQLLGETESMEFVEAWLAGKPTPFIGGSQGLNAGRVQVLEMVVRNSFQVGSLAVPGSFCLETFYAYEAVHPGAGLLLLDQFPLTQWPENILTGSRPPQMRFNPQKKEWVNYLSRLSELSLYVDTGKAVSIEAWSKDEVRPGALEQYVLWKSRRLDSSDKSIVWLETVCAQLGKHPSMLVRELKRVCPALAYALKTEMSKTAVP